MVSIYVPFSTTQQHAKLHFNVMLTEIVKDAVEAFLLNGLDGDEFEELCW